MEVNMEQNMENIERSDVSPALDEAAAAEIDRRVAEALERARAQWEADQAQAQAERQRLEAMSAEERAGYEASRREAELAERERKVMERELRAMALEKLAERGLPRELADALPYTGETACLQGIDRMERVFRQAVQSAVDERLRGETPASGGGRRLDDDSLSDAEYYRLNA